MNVVEAEGLVKKYGDGTAALKGIDLRIDKKNTIILGQNGAGKTTLLRILSTQLSPTSGRAKVLGYDVLHDADKVRRRIVSIPQEADIMEELTPQEHLEIYLAARGMDGKESAKRIEKAFKALGLYGVKDKTANFLSGGMKRKIFVSMALASDAELVFLDEPTLGLDPISRLEVWSAIRKLKGKVILTTHYLEEAKFLADEIVLINSGRVAMKGTVEGLLKPLGDLMRVDGLEKGDKSFRIGDIRMSYLAPREAIRYSKKGFEVRQLDLEDLFILGEFK